MARLTRVRRDATLVRGRLHAAEQRWDEALACFEQALRIDPTSQLAYRAIEDTKTSAARTLYRGGVHAADGGDLDGARRSLEHAARYRADDAGITAALRSLDPARRSASPAAPHFEQAVTVVVDRRWEEGRKHLEQAVTLDPDFLPARSQLHRVNQALARARELLANGRQALAARQLDRAVASLAAGLEVAPHDQTIRALHDRAAGRLREAEELIAEAEKHRAASRWDDAIRCASAALELFAGNRAATRIEEDARTRAAAQCVKGGRRELASGRIDAAESSFRKALGYRPELEDATEGLADVSAARAEAAGRRGNWGHAWLWYLEAADRHPSRTYEKHIERTHRRIAERLSTRLNLHIRTAGGDPSAETIDLEQRLLPELQRRCPPFLLAFATRAPGTPSGIPVAVTTIALELNTELATREELSRTYHVERPVPNPEIHKIEGLIAVSQSQVQSLRRRLGRCRREAEAVRPKEDAEAGDAEKRYQQLRRRAQSAADDLDKEERQLERLRDRLRRTPATATLRTRRAWPYTRSTYRKTGRFMARLSVAGQAQDDLQTVVAEACREDVEISNANPDIGLEPDPLKLPSDATLRAELFQKAAEEIAVTAIGRAVHSIADREQAAADRARQRGELQPSLEAEANVVYVLARVDRERAESRLAELRKQLTTR